MSGRLTLTLSLAKQSPALQRVLDATRAAPPTAAQAPIPAPAPKAVAPAPKAVATPRAAAPAPKVSAPAPRAVVAATPTDGAPPKPPKAPRPERPPVFVHAEADPETAAWNRAREDEWHAAHPPPPPPTPPLHQRADAETIAWNQERDREWLAAPAAVEAALRELCPLAFCHPPRPLAIGIHQPLVDNYY